MTDYSDYGLGPWPPSGGAADDADSEEFEVDGYIEPTTPPVYEPSVPDWEAGWWSWDTVTLGNQDLPGIATVDIKTKRKLDIKSAPGASGATITDQGYEPADVKISLRMWTREHLGMMEAMLKFISPKLSDITTAWDIMHPSTTLHGIVSVYIRGIDGPKRDRDGTWTLDLDCVEWFPSPKKNQTKTATKSKATDESSKDESLADMLDELDKPSDDPDFVGPV